MKNFQSNHETAEKAPNFDAAETVRSLRSRALACRLQGEHRKAESLYLEALRLLENAAGADHPDLVPLLNNLARIHEDRSEYTRAEQLYQRSVRVLEGAGDKVELEKLRVRSLSGL